MSIYSIDRAKQLLDTLFYKSAEYWLANVDKVEQVIDWLCDEESKVQYRKEISRRILANIIGNVQAANTVGNVTFHEWNTLGSQFDRSKFPPLVMNVKNDSATTIMMSGYILEEYRYKDIFYPSNEDIVIDAGAYCGETSVWFMQYDVKKVYAFEPSAVQYPYLIKNIHDLHYNDRIVPIHLGLSNTKGHFSFIEDAGGSRIADQGNSRIETTTLDIFCKELNIRPTLLKFDIEGAELSALEGSIDFIKKYKPKIAICLYHQIQDMLSIPFYLKQLVPEYRFYCKASNPVTEFVLFAIV